MKSGPQFLEIDIGDWATWVSAIGTFVAVAVALSLGRRDGKRREEDRLARGTVIAAFLFADIGVIHRALKLAEAELAKVDATTPGSAMKAHMFLAYKMIKEADTSKISAHLDKLVDLPARHAISIAAVPDSVKTLIEALFDQANPGANATMSELRDTALTLLPQVRITKQNLESFIAHFEPKFVR